METMRAIRQPPVALRVSYDRAVDVLHLAAGEPSAVEGEGLACGVELDFSVDDGRPCGVTVLGYHRHGWSERLADLATIVGRHLSLSPGDVAGAIRQHLAG